MSEERWMLAGDALDRPQVFFSENSARRQAERIEAATNVPVQVIRQHLVNGKWVDDEGKVLTHEDISRQAVGPPPWRLNTRGA